MFVYPDYPDLLSQYFDIFTNILIQKNKIVGYVTTVVSNCHLQNVEHVERKRLYTCILSNFVTSNKIYFDQMYFNHETYKYFNMSVTNEVP